MFQEAIGMTERKIKRAIYEPNNSDLNLRKKIYELDINYASNIIVYFWGLNNKEILNIYITNWLFFYSF